MALCAEHRQTIHPSALSINETLERDPTRTTTLRNQFASEMRKRFRRLRGVIRQAIVEDDVFGFRSETPTTFAEMASPGPGAFAFNRTQDKVDAFSEWLNTQTERGVLETKTRRQLGEPIEGAWTDQYIGRAYKTGIQRGHTEMKKAGYRIPSIDEAGGLDVLFNSPAHADRAGAMYTRTFSDLKGITSAMDTQVSRVLTDSLIKGDHPRLMAKRLNRTITGPSGDLGLTDSLGRWIPAERRAAMLARTETIRAHHLATVQEYRSYEMEGVKVQAEWSTAGHGVCPVCAALEGSVYTLDEIEPMIPKHPNCRCQSLPLDVTDEEQEAAPAKSKAAL